MRVFFHVVSVEVLKVHRMLHIDSSDRDLKKGLLVGAFWEYCEGKANMTVVQYKCRTYSQTTQKCGKVY